jgi:hypothetical protein
MTRSAPPGLDPQPVALGPLLWVSGLRCVLVYLGLPLAAPLLGLTPALSRPLQTGSALAGAAWCGWAMWRAWRAGHNRRIVVAALLASLNLFAAGW